MLYGSKNLLGIDTVSHALPYRTGTPLNAFANAVYEYILYYSICMYGSTQSQKRTACRVLRPIYLTRVRGFIISVMTQNMTSLT